MTVIIIFMADERYVRCNLFTRRRSRRVKRILTSSNHFVRFHFHRCRIQDIKRKFLQKIKKN